MSDAFLEVTYRSGRPFAAYLYLSKAPQRSAETRQHGQLLADYAEDGTLLGIELTQPERTSLEEINTIIRAARMPELALVDLRPLAAA